jgi:hypothetical protein
MSNWRNPEYSYADLCDTLSDYHKEVYGVRCRMFCEDESNREQVIAELESLDSYMEIMRSTFAGREQLRSEGWYIEETDAMLAEQARLLAEQRDTELWPEVEPVCSPEDSRYDEMVAFELEQRA